MAIVNAHAFNQGLGSGNYAWHLALGAHDRAAELFANLVFAHRSLPVLAFLLGVGLVVQTRHLERAKVGAVLLQRYAVLLAIGLVHGFLLWPGDILAAYAFIVLVLARFAVTWSRPTLWWVATALLFYTLAPALHEALTAHDGLDCWGEMLAAPSSFAQQDWLTARRIGASEFLEFGLRGQGLNAMVATLVLLGVACARADGFWQHLQQPSFLHPVFIASAALLAGSSALEWQTGPAGGWLALACTGRAMAQFHLAETVSTFASVPVLLTLFARLAQRWTVARPLRLLQSVGRAPLTMFIGQSILLTLAFSPMFVGLNGQVGRASVLAIAVLSYALLAVWIELAFVRRGTLPPAERLWRRLSFAGQK